MSRLARNARIAHDDCLVKIFLKKNFFTHLVTEQADGKTYGSLILGVDKGFQKGIKHI